MKGLWFTLYGICMTILFLYLLFPGELVKNKLEDAINSNEFMLTSTSLHPALPLGIKLKNVTIHLPAQDFILFRGELLDLQLNLFRFPRKNTYIGLSGNAYEGSFNGYIGFKSLRNVYPPVEARLHFENIDIGNYPLFRGDTEKSLTGRAHGFLSYVAEEAGRSASGTLSLFFKKGSYLLAEPFLGVTRIYFDRGEIQAQMKNGIFKVEKIETFGPQMNCFLKGDITPAAEFKNSQLNLTGTIEILGKGNVKMKVTIGGTWANPAIRYI